MPTKRTVSIRPSSRSWKSLVSQYSKYRNYLKGVDLADENPKGNEDCGSTETSFQNSKKVEKLEIKCIFSYFRFYRDDSIAIIGELPISSKYPRFCKKKYLHRRWVAQILHLTKRDFAYSGWLSSGLLITSFWTYLLALLTLS